eukprot:6032337-Pleurochrysis_carterae.AAC.1
MSSMPISIERTEAIRSAYIAMIRIINCPAMDSARTRISREAAAFKHLLLVCHSLNRAAAATKGHWKGCGDRSGREGARRESSQLI